MYIHVWEWVCKTERQRKIKDRESTNNAMCWLFGAEIFFKINIETKFKLKTYSLFYDFKCSTLFLLIFWLQFLLPRNRKSSVLYSILYHVPQRMPLLNMSALMLDSLRFIFLPEICKICIIGLVGSSLLTTESICINSIWHPYKYWRGVVLSIACQSC